MQCKPRSGALGHGHAVSHYISRDVDGDELSHPRAWGGMAIGMSVGSAKVSCLLTPWEIRLRAITKRRDLQAKERVRRAKWGQFYGLSRECQKIVDGSRRAPWIPWGQSVISWVFLRIIRTGSHNNRKKCSRSVACLLAALLFVFPLRPREMQIQGECRIRTFNANARQGVLACMARRCASSVPAMGTKSCREYAALFSLSVWGDSRVSVWPCLGMKCPRGVFPDVRDKLQQSTPTLDVSSKYGP